MESKAKELEAAAMTSGGEPALSYTISAVELYMKAAAEATSEDDRRRLRQKCKQLISKAEYLKGTLTIQSIDAGRPLSVHERELLRRSSSLHGTLFPVWDQEPGPTHFRREATSLYNDPFNFSFSRAQEQLFAGWKRPLELARTSNAGTADDAAMVVPEEYDLVQDVTTDCSVVSSLCAGMRRLSHRIDPLLPTLMFPFDKMKGRPAVSENGKYVFRMYFNGCFRQVAIDDRLPSSRTSRSLFVKDRNNPHLIWPALMEKAYLKVRGGYDFPGSNSGTDLWILTGWIPEQIFLQSDDLDAAHLWSRMRSAYARGDVIVTLGTRRMSPEEEEALGLAGEHDYAVMDLKEESGLRRLLVKNPWADGLVWKGVGSLVAKTASLAVDTGAPSLQLLTGSFWITLDDILQNFESLYLNWNPTIFAHRQDHHFAWTLPQPTVALSFSDNPQYCFGSPKGGTVWILLSRHFQDAEHALIRRDPAQTAEAEGADGAPSTTSLGFTSLYVFDNNQGRRVQLGERALLRGPYVDSPQVLAKMDSVEPGRLYTVVVAQQGLRLPGPYTFTLSFLSTNRVAVEEARERLRHHATVEGEWNPWNAGGSTSSPDFYKNPQFSISIPSRTGTGSSRTTTPLTLLLSTANDEARVRVDLAWAGGRRVETNMTVRDVAASSGDYRRGSCVADLVSADVGSTFTAVCSTFVPGQLGRFALRASADVPLVVTPLPADAAGLLQTTCNPVRFPDGVEAVAARVTLTAAWTKVYALALNRRNGSGGGSGTRGGGSGTGGGGGLGGSADGGAGEPGSRYCPIRARLEYGRGPDRIVLAETGGGEFVDAACPLRTGQVNVDRDKAGRWGLWIVVERMMGHGEAHDIVLDLFHDVKLYVGDWEAA